MNRIQFLRRGWLILAVLVPLIAVSCSGGSGDSDDLEDIEWELATLNGADALEDTTVVLEFASEGQMFGSGGCNRFIGSWETGDDNALTLEPGGTTLMACPEPISQQEQEFLSALSATASFEIDGDELTLQDGDDNELATMTKLEPADLTGTEWEAIAINNGQDAVVGLVEGTTITALFNEDGTLAGNGGCNQYNTTFEVDGDEISISEGVASTLMACDQAIMDQELAHIQAITQAATFELGSDTLELRDADGALLVSYKLADS